MPLYHYQCSSEECNHRLEEFSTIAEMLEREKIGVFCARCNEPMHRDYRPQRHVKFHEGVYENVADEPMHISSAQQLMDACRENGNSSVYMKDMAGLFGARENRWI